jgi:AcrR family transcriptional regulator
MSEQEVCMGRKRSIDEGELIHRLGTVFRAVGFDGASLTSLAEATGLQKASLYHRFPDGKEQMAREVLDAAAKWLDEHVLSVLKGGGTPKERLREVAKRLDEFYSGGRQACLLNVMSSPYLANGPFGKSIKQMFDALIGALCAAVIDAGVDRKVARHRAEQAVVRLQGSLVVSRGTGTTRLFREFVDNLPNELLARE